MLKSHDSAEDPLVRLRDWYAQADAHPAIRYAHSAVLATTAADQPDARVVLIHGFGARHLTFGTDARSAKAQQLRQAPRAALVFYWEPLERQVRLRGAVEPGDDAEADATYDDRPRDSRITGWASHQSQPLPDRASLEDRWQRAAGRFADQGVVDRPATWQAYRFIPHEIEFWQAGRFRLHQRDIYTRGSDGQWQRSSLQP